MTPETTLPHCLAFLASERRFVGWRWVQRPGKAKPDKVPFQPNGTSAKSNDPATWATFAEVEAVRQSQRFDGVGIQLLNLPGCAALDLDNVRAPETGDVLPWARQLVEACGSYAEITPSGTGLRIIGSVSHNHAAMHTKRQHPEGGEVEFFVQPNTGRFITLTGNKLDAAPDCLAMIEGPIASVHAVVAPQPSPQLELAPAEASTEVPDVSLVNDEQAIAFVRGSEANRRNWDGEGVSDQSKAFGAIVGALALVGCSREQALRLALASPLVVNGPPHSRGSRADKSAWDFDRIWSAAARKGAAERQEQAARTEHGRQNAEALLAGWNGAQRAHGEALGQPATSRFRVQHVTDLEAHEPDYLIDGLFERRSLGGMFGAPACGKTFAALDMASCVATCRDYHGRTVKQGGVVYIVGEGASAFKRRVSAWERHSGTSLSRDVTFFIVPMPVEMLNDADVTAACDAIAEAVAGRSISLIVIDTLARNFGDGDENSTKDMNRFVAAVGRMMDRFSCAALVVHHSGHENQARARGSVSFRAALDAEFRVEKTHDLITLTHTKAKDGPEHAPITFGTEFVELGRDRDDKPFGSLVLVERKEQTIRAKTLTKAQERAMTAFNDAARESGRYAPDGHFIGVHRDDWRRAFYRIATQDNEDSKSKAFRRACTDLVELGELDVSDDVFSHSGAFACVKNSIASMTRNGAGQPDGHRTLPDMSDGRDYGDARTDRTNPL